MKRFKLILAVAATMAAIMAFFAVPAMAAPEYRFFDDGFLFSIAKTSTSTGSVTTTSF